MQPFCAKMAEETDVDKRTMLDKLLMNVKGAVDEVEQAMKASDKDAQDKAKQVYKVAHILAQSFNRDNRISSHSGIFHDAVSTCMYVW